MQPPERDASYLWDMLDAARRIEEFVRGITEDQYRTDLLRQMAVERALEVIGEAANRVSEDFQSAHPEIPWRRIVAQRNFLAHQYRGVAQERIWEVVSVHVPVLIAQLQPLVPRAPEEP